ncbi:SWIM zinc finger family protein [Saccharothrix violaceirubra]|uniref:SWIM-type domain-containing protein n=1 Tax=Saccharothrix violaceirubra TaxID=413306 RepID=A0A7W7T377_9PSEU|nr:SWIM zinc finger family protein [Saccharothrix violaceirubra]MBB4965676.1 hypothetical protein [Saccharothrix violaceirubra]
MVWFDDAELRRNAGDTWYSRGLGYVDRVEGLTRSATEVVAAVTGTDEYTVRLWRKGRRLAADCSCPWGQLGNFCKHCVAVGLVALATRPEPESEPEVDLRAYLDGVPREGLVDLVLGLAARDDEVRLLLSRRALGSAGPRPEELYDTVDALRPTSARDLVRVVRAAEDVLGTLETLAVDHPATAAVLARRALANLVSRRLRTKNETLRDSVHDTVTRTVHVLAKLPAADPAEFARWLLGVQRDAPDFPEIAVAGLADALGDEGLDEYGRLVAGPLRDVYLREIVGDVDAKVAEYARGQDAGRYLRIAEELRAVGRNADAASRLRRGLLDATPARRELADALRDLEPGTDPDREAAAGCWAAFEEQPDEFRFRVLLAAAEPLDAVDYARKRAFALLRRRAATEGGRTLVEIMVAAGDFDGAWAAAHEFGCGPVQWFLVARHRARTHPAQAAPIFEYEIDGAIAAKTPEGYRKAAALLVRLRGLHERCGVDFAAYLERLKSEHHRKKALLDSLSSAGL